MRTRRITVPVLVAAVLAAAAVSLGPSLSAVADTPTDPLPPVCGTWVLQQVNSVADLDGIRSQLEASLRTPGVRGLSIRTGWNKIDGNLSIFDRAYEIAQAAGKELSIRVMAGRHTPARVFDLGAYFYVDSAGERIPKPFSDGGVAGNPVFEQQYRNLVNTLGAWSRSHGVRLLHLPWYGHLWAEIDNGSEIQASPGYSLAAWTTGHLTLLDAGLAESNADLSIEYAMSGYWGNAGPEATKFHQRITSTVGDWSGRVFLQGNALGKYNFPPASGKPIHTGMQMYDGSQYDWNAAYTYAESVEATYVEVYTSSFTGNTNGTLSSSSADFMGNFDAACRYGAQPSPSPTATPTPSPSTAPSPSPSPTTAPSPSTSPTTSPSVTPSPSPTAAPSPTTSPSVAPSPSPAPISAPEPAPSPSPTPTLPADTVSPQTTLSDPRSGATIGMGSIMIAGTATDDRSISSVNVAIRNKTSRLWWHVDGSWGAYEAQAASLSGAGSTAGSWSYRWTPGAPGTFILVARGQDAAGNFDPTPAGSSFTVGADTKPASVAATALRPSGRAQARAKGQMVLKGRSSDDRAIGAVLVAVLDKRTGRWWHPDGRWGTFRYFRAELTRPHARTSQWRIHLRARPGKYRVQIAGIDTSGNVRIRWIRMEIHHDHVRIGRHHFRR